MGKDIAKAVLKCSYPLTGNLPSKVRQGLEKKFGEDTFNAVNSAGLTILSNLVTYPLAGYLATKNPLAIPIGIVYALAEDNCRLHWMLESEQGKVYDIPGSLPGKIASLPIEYGMSLYKKAESQVEK